MKKARIIITFDCKRNCSYCCNKYESMKALMIPTKSLTKFFDYDEVILTGGEPFLHTDKLIKIIEFLRHNSKNQKQKIFLYTAQPTFGFKLKRVLRMVDGVHYTLHSNSSPKDLAEFYQFQKEILGKEGKSFRLYISPELKYPVTIQPQVWARVELKPWIPEGQNCLPKDEELYYLKDENDNIYRM